MGHLRTGAARVDDVSAAVAPVQDRRGEAPASRAERVGLLLLTVELGTLLVTGIALFFLYEPSAGAAWPGLALPDARSTQPSDALRLVHRLASTAAVPTALVVGVLVALRREAVRRRWPAVLLGLGIVAATAAAAVSGFLLPWDQLALRAVTVGTRMNGYSHLFGDEVLFAIVDGVEVSRQTIVRWLVVHTTVLGVALAALLGLAWRRHRDLAQRRGAA